MKQNLVCFFDGACEPINPGGNMGLGACIFEMMDWRGQPEKKNEVYRASEFFAAEQGNTNNVAEYFAFEKVLNWLRRNFDNEHHQLPVFIYGDSNLVIQQMLGKWRIKNGYYVPVAHRCRKIMEEMEQSGIKLLLQWIPRQKNQYADDLSKGEFKTNGVELRLQHE